MVFDMDQLSLTPPVSFREYAERWRRCRHLLTLHLPQAEGLLVFSRLNIYYLTGSFANGVFWLPLEGEPVLLVRRGLERARLESPLSSIFAFQTYRDLQEALRLAGAPLTSRVAAETNGLSWGLGRQLANSLNGVEFLAGDRILAMCRAVKSESELLRLRAAGARHARCLLEELPSLLHVGMSEFDIARVLSDIFFAAGHQGILRMDAYGEEVFQGHIAVGDSANYPSVFNGPVGLRGVHPAVPHMGSPDVRWQDGQLLTIDNGFSLEGYQTDKTVVYWSGKKERIPAQALRAHDFCIGLQRDIADRLRPGAVPAAIWRHALGAAEEEGWSAGFMGLGGNKVSFVGHGIGLAVDEYPVFAEKFELPLEEGMVLAVEPKIGLPGVGMVGVENTFEVTSSGGRSLTGDRFDIVCIDSDSL